MKVFLYIFCIILLNSCVKNNEDPSWIEIASWELIENPDEEGQAGELTHNFKDAYISVNGKIIGFFQLPVKIPLLMSGNSEIIIYPVVRNNGISATKKIYPFCKEFTIQAELIQNETLKISPKTNYNSNLQFWIEDFEDAAFDLTNDPVSSAQLVKDNVATYLKYGNFYGHVTLNSVDSNWIASSIEFTNVPKGGAEVYLEIDYMTSNKVLTALNASVDGTERSNPNIQLNDYDYENVGWKKIYIDLKELVSSFPTASYFKHYFTAVLEPGSSETQIFIDNIRFIYNK